MVLTEKGQPMAIGVFGLDFHAAPRVYRDFGKVSVIFTNCLGDELTVTVEELDNLLKLARRAVANWGPQLPYAPPQHVFPV